MCGRYVIFSTPEAIRALFRYGEQPNFPPRYNIAPTQPIPIVRRVDGKRSFALMRWGLLPSWVQDPKTFPLLINARGESVLDKPAFRTAIARSTARIDSTPLARSDRNEGRALKDGGETTAILRVNMTRPPKRS